jgi:HEAT repeat protein
MTRNSRSKERCEMHTLTLLLALTTTAVPAAELNTNADGPLPLASGLISWINDQTTPADSLHRAGQAALTRREYQRAVDTYRELRRRYPRSPRVADAYYWEAFALQRLGGSTNLRVARERLQTQERDHPNAGTMRDARSLRVRVERDLANGGDAEARAWLDERAERVDVTAASPATPAVAGTPTTVPTPAAASNARARGGRAGSPDAAPEGCDQARFEEQAMAVQALFTMDRDRSVPILRRLMARRDPCAGPLRRQAIFILSQHAGDDPEIVPTLLDVVRNDPDREVKRSALFALGQTGNSAAVPALAEILRNSNDEELQRGAIFALSQTSDDRGTATLREFVQRTDAPDELIGHAVLFLGQKGAAEAAFLRQIYPRLRSEQARKMVMMTLAQTGDAENARWLMDRVLDRNEDMEVRKSALFFVGTQSDAVDTRQIIGLYSPNLDVEMRRQILFVLSQRREPAATDKLLDVARNDPDRDLRKQAIFWLGQSGDPRAAELIERMLDQ